MRSPVLMPDVGVPTAVVSAWYAALGETVFVGDRVVEVFIGSATIDIAAPVTGVLMERSAGIDTTVRTGQVLGYIEEE